MTYSTFKKIKIIITSFVSVTVAMAVVLNNMSLAIAGVVIGLLFLTLVKRTSKMVLVDERVKIISGYAARMTYTILTTILAVLSLLIISNSRESNGMASFEILGIVLSYITLLSLALYALSFKYYSKKYGDKDEE